MGQIFNPPKEMKIPEFDFKKSRSENEKAVDDFIINLKKLIIEKIHKGKEVENCGEVIDFPVADGKAMYMVASMKPLILIHLPLYDAWKFEYANRLTAKDVREKIKNQKALKELFKSK